MRLVTLLTVLLALAVDREVLAALNLTPAPPIGIPVRPPATNFYVGTFVGDGKGLSNVTAALPAGAVLSSNVNRFAWANTLQKVQTTTQLRVMEFGNSYIGTFDPEVRQYFGHGAFGLLSGIELFSQGANYSGTYANVDNPSVWPCGVPVMSGSTGTVSFALSDLQSGDQFGIYYLTTNGAGTFKLQTNLVDATGTITVGTNANRFYSYILTNAAGPVPITNITAVSLSGAGTYILGVHIVNSWNSGPVLCGLYRGSGLISYFLTNSAARQAVTNFAPDLILLGHKEPWLNLSNDLVSLKGWLSTNAPTADLVMSGPWPLATNDWNVDAGIGAAVACSAAVKYGWSYFDAYNLWGGYQSFTNRGIYNPTIDNVHLSGYGQTVWGQHFFKWLALEDGNTFGAWNNSFTRFGSLNVGAGWSFNNSAQFWVGENGPGDVGLWFEQPNGKFRQGLSSNYGFVQTHGGDTYIKNIHGPGYVDIYSGQYVSLRIWPSGGMSLGSAANLLGDPGPGSINTSGNLILTNSATGIIGGKGEFGWSNSPANLDPLLANGGGSLVWSNGILWATWKTNGVFGRKQLAP